MNEFCSYGDCGRLRGKALGLCDAHYARQRLGRAMEPPIRNSRATDSERFWSKVDKSGECWLWRAGTMRGYGIFRIDSGNRVAHRVSYVWENGPIPDGAEVDHMCFNRSCVRPSHLRLLDHQKNGQNRSSANTNSKTGVRGVYWNGPRKGYMAAASVRDRIYRMGPFPTVEEAESAIVAWRRENMPASINDQRKAG
jgi:hypothetical protein